MRGGGSFTNPPRRLVLTSPNGSRIILDADEAKISMFGINGNLLAELDASAEFFGDSIFLQRVFDSNGNLVAQFGGLVIQVIGADGTALLSAGSSGVPTSQPRLGLDPFGSSDTGYIQAQPEADNGGALLIRSPAFNSNGQAEINVYSQSDVDDSRVIFATTDVEFNGPSGADFFALNIGAGNTAAPFLRLHNKTLGFNVANIHMLSPPAPAGLTSATPITITGASTTTFVKASNATQVEVHMSGGGYITAGAGASVTFGILISGGVGDFSIVKGSFSSLSNRIQFSGSRLLSAFNAGSYTITPRWFRNAGASTVIMDATDASLTVTLEEVRQA